MKNNKLKISKRAQNVIASPIRKFLPLINETEKRGVYIHKLNVGDPDLMIPKTFFKEINKYVNREKQLGYAPSSGSLQHISAWRKYYEQWGVKLQPENIVPTLGCAEAIMFAMQAVADPGDEIIVFEPLYVSYKSFSVMSGIKLVPVLLRIDNNFLLTDKKFIESKITKKTKAIVIINPDNPTGKLWNSSELKMILSVAKKRNLFVISDETYREIRFDDKRPNSLLSNATFRDRVIVCDSISKRFSIPGARLGCVASFNLEVMRAVLKFAQARLSVPTLEQFAASKLISNSSGYVKKIVKEYKLRRKILINELGKIKGVKFLPSQGAFYQSVSLPIKSAEDFVKFLVTEFSYKKQTVMVTPMQDFYISKGMGVNEIRIAYVVKSKDLKVAISILGRGLKAFLEKNWG